MIVGVIMVGVIVVMIVVMIVLVLADNFLDNGGHDFSEGRFWKIDLESTSKMNVSNPSISTVFSRHIM